jgi:glycosyltransferase involved in cell wall biosynthesis
MFMSITRRIFGFRLLIDAHNEGVEPYTHNHAIIRAFTKFCHRHAERTIVTNSRLAEVIERNGGRPIVLPDAIPPIPAAAHQISALDDSETPETETRPVLCVIATFAKDEPIEQIIDALPKMRTRAKVYITGNLDRLSLRVRVKAPDNVQFTGFLPELEYWKLLARATVIIDLTTRENCLVCGAYEALAVGVPVVISDDPSAREIFGDGMCYTKTDPTSIAAAIDQVIDGGVNWRIRSISAAEQYELRWSKLFAQFESDVRALAHPN